MSEKERQSWKIGEYLKADLIAASSLYYTILYSGIIRIKVCCFITNILRFYPSLTLLKLCVPTTKENVCLSSKIVKGCRQSYNAN